MSTPRHKPKSKDFKILITGAGGQVAEAIKEESHFFYSLHCVFLSKKELNITSASSINLAIKNYSPDIILNTAAYTNVDAAEDNKAEAYQINRKAVRLLAQECKSASIAFIHLSTDYIFDGRKNSGYVEEDFVNPQSVYGSSKLSGEVAIINLELPIYAIIRTSWVYSSYKTNFVKTMLRLAKVRKEIAVVEDQKGSPTYANDLAKALLIICTKLTKKTSGVYHYANEGSVSWFEFAKAIFKYSKIDIDVLPVTSEVFPSKATRPSFSILSSSKICKTFDIKIPRWEDSLREMLLKND